MNSANHLNGNTLVHVITSYYVTQYVILLLLAVTHYFGNTQPPNTACEWHFVTFALIVNSGGIGASTSAESFLCSPLM